MYLSFNPINLKQCVEFCRMLWAQKPVNISPQETPSREQGTRSYGDNLPLGRWRGITVNEGQLVTSYPSTSSIRPLDLIHWDFLSRHFYFLWQQVVK